MKKLIITLSLCGLSILLNAQDVSVEKSIYGVQTGLLGIWIHQEARLSDKLALRTELGLDSELWGGTYDRTGYLLTPVLTLEPRWYYNLDKRNSQSKNINGNSGNFLSLKASFHPDWFVISNHEDIRIISDISIIPTWGIRRQMGSHFAFETGIGIGYRYIFAKSVGYEENESEAAVNLHLRLGYRF